MAERGKAKLPARFPRHPVPRSAISFPEPTCLLVSTKTRSVLVLTKRHVGSGNEIGRSVVVSESNTKQSKANLNYQSLLLFYLLRPFKGDRPKGRFVIHNNLVGVKALLHRRFLSRQLDAIFVALNVATSKSQV